MRLQVVVLNTIALAMDRYGISEELENSLSTANIVFSTMFGLEMAVKLAGVCGLGLGVVLSRMDRRGL